MSRVERTAEGKRRLAVAFALLCASVWPARVQAQPDEPVALTWNAPSGCSSAREVLLRVRQLTQSAQLPDQQLQAEATIGPRTRGQLHLRLMLRAGELVGERNIDGRSCDDLAGATAVVLALLLRSAGPLSGTDLVGQPATSEASSATGTASVTDASTAAGEQAARGVAQSVERRDTNAAQNARRPERRWRAVLQLPLAALAIGPLPRPGVGFSLAGGARFERWSLMGEGSYWLAQKLRSTSQPGAGAVVQRVEAALRACRAFAFGNFELAPCARVAVLHLWARGTGAHIAARTAKATWLAVGLGVQARYHISQWFCVVGGLDAHVHTAQPKVSIADVGSLGQLWPAALTVNLGGEWIF